MCYSSQYIYNVFCVPIKRLIKFIPFFVLTFLFVYSYFTIFSLKFLFF